MIFSIMILLAAMAGLMLMVWDFACFVWRKVDDLIHSLRSDRLDPILFDDER